jgi:thymidylate synthase
VKVIRATHVDDALCQGLQHLADAGVIEDSARGPVIVAATPVTTHFVHPMNNASLCPIRDANPFFHLVEALWMLSGQSDARMLDPYIKGFSARVAEEDGYDHGAYGFRWRSSLGFDQLEHIIQMLTNDPTTRQAVLQMWDAGLDSHDLRGVWKDRPCNTHVYFRIINTDYLDMTVCNRSNDIIWGAYGANAVHFSFLQQYMASRLGLKANSYYQVSNNFHAYVSELNNLGRRIPDFISVSPEQKLLEIVAAMHRRRPALHHDYAVPDLNVGLADLQHLMDVVNRINDSVYTPVDKNNGLASSIFHAAYAHAAYREGEHYLALQAANDIPWHNWREACVGWLQRRIKVREEAALELVPGE